MSAIAIRAYRDRAYLLADGAYYDTDGVIRTISSKFAISTAHHAALAVSGHLFPSWLLGDTSFGSQADIMAAVPELMRARRAVNDEINPHAVGSNDFQVFAALWSARSGGSGWAISSDQAWFGDSYMPYTWICLDEASSPDVPHGMRITPQSAKEDARAILETQRVQPWPDGRFCVGGFGEMAIVDRNGARLIEVARWPDQIGELIAA